MKGAKARILASLRNRRLTGMEIVKATGCLDYRKRISELRADGHPVGGNFVTVENRWGELCRVMRYYLNAAK